MVGRSSTLLVLRGRWGRRVVPSPCFLTLRTSSPARNRTPPHATARHSVKDKFDKTRIAATHADDHGMTLLHRAALTGCVGCGEMLVRLRLK